MVILVHLMILMGDVYFGENNEAWATWIWFLWWQWLSWLYFEM